MCFYFVLAERNMVDVAILLGAHGAKKDVFFQGQLDFITKLFDKYKISTKDVLPGGIRYGKDATVVIKLGDVSTREDAKVEFTKITNPGDGNNLDVALISARDILFKDARRRSHKTILIFVDKKLQNVDGWSLSRITKSLRDIGIRIVVVGIGNEVDQAEIESIAPNDKACVFSPEDLIALNRLVIPVRDCTLPGKFLCSMQNIEYIKIVPHGFKD